MQLVDRFTDHLIALGPMLPNLSGSNQREFRRLNLLLGLRLRRQIVLAVCDDLQLRDWLVAQIEASVAGTVTLPLNLNDPDLMVQISRALSEASTLHPDQTPHLFQLTGIERLTHRSPYAQQLFLDRLQQMPSNHPTLRDMTLLIWVTRPWLNAIQQAAPAFWQRHTAIFSFEGDPTPTGLESASRPLLSLPETPAATSASPANASGLPVENLVPDEIASLWELLPDQPTATLKVFPSTLSGADSAATVPDLPALPPAQPVALPDEFLNLVQFMANHTHLQAGDEPIMEALQTIEHLHQQAISADELAVAYHHLAILCRDRLEPISPTLADIETACHAYQQTLNYLEPDSPLRADVLNDLGNLYWMQSRQEMPDRRQIALQQSIATYQQALTTFEPEAQPQTFAMIQNNLGAAYADLAAYQNGADAFEKAVTAYESALKYREADTDPARYAATQNNLGTAYWNLAQHQQPLHYLTQAVAAYQKALQYYTSEQEPLKHAMIQNNLGTTYWNLAQCDQLASAQKQIGHPDLCRPLLENAIVSYRTALLYRTPEVTPGACAATYNNLGAAYWHLAMLESTAASDQLKYLQLAIHAYTQALNLAQNSEASQGLHPGFDPVATCNNLGLTYYYLAQHPQVESGKRLQILIMALNSHTQAIKSVDASNNTYDLTLNYSVQVIRGCYNAAGLKGQTQALSQLPAHLLPEIMKRL